MQVFNEEDFRDFIMGWERTLVEQVRGEQDNYILNVNEAEYVAHVVDRYSLDAPAIRRDLVHVESREERIPAEKFPRGFDVRQGQSYPRQVLRYFVPVDGDIKLLRYVPSTRLLWSAEMGITENSLTFDIIVWSEDPERVKREADEVLNNLETQNRHLSGDAKVNRPGFIGGSAV